MKGATLTKDGDYEVNINGLGKVGTLSASDYEAAKNGLRQVAKMIEKVHWIMEVQEMVVETKKIVWNIKSKK